MNGALQIPEQPLERFLAIYQVLAKERRWHQSAAPLQFAALAALALPGDASMVAHSVRRTAEQIKERTGMFGALHSELRFIVAATLLERGDTVDAFCGEIKRVLPMFRQERLPRRKAYETMAILVLRVDGGLSPIQSTAAHRLKAIYEQLKRYHWWLTGPGDLPVCALLACRTEHPEQIGGKIEQLYQALHEQKFKKGNYLQTAANMLYLSDLDVDLIARRMSGLAKCFREAGVSIWQTDYGELALLAFVNHPTNRVADRVIQYREAIKQLRPRPANRSLTFNQACSLVFLELIEADERMKLLVDVKAMMDMQGMIDQRNQATAT